MVGILTPKQGVQARGAGQVGNSGSSALLNASAAAQGAANTFSDFYDKKAAIENDRILAQAQSDWTRNFAEQSRSAGNGFATNILQGYDSYVQEVLSNDTTPQRGRDVLEASLAKYRIGLEGKALQREAAARAAASAAAAAEARKLRGNAIVLDNSQMEDAIANASSAEEKSYYLRLGLSARMDQSPQDVLDSVQSGKWNNILTPQQTQAFITAGNRGVERIQREVTAADNVAKREYENTVAEQVAYGMVQGYIPLDGNMSNDSIDATANGDTEWAAEQKRIRDNANIDIGNANLINNAPQDVIDSELARLKAEVEKPGYTQEDQRRLASFLALIAARDQAIQNDSAGWVARNNDTVSVALEQYTKQDTPEGQAAAADVYVNNLAARYDATGVPTDQRSILPDSVAKSYVAMFNDLGSDVVSQTLKQFVESWGGNSAQVISELGAAGLQPEYVSAMRYADNPVLAQEIINMAGVPLADFKKGLATTTVADQKIADTFANAMSVFEFAAADGSAMNSFNDIINIAQKMVYTRMRAGVNGATATADVYSQLLPGPIVNETRAKIIAPAGFDQNVISNFVQNSFDANTLKDFDVQEFDDPSQATSTDIGVMEASLDSNGVWTNNETGDGIFLMIRVGAGVLPVYDSYGNPVEMKFSMLAGYNANKGVTSSESTADSIVRALTGK